MKKIIKYFILTLLTLTFIFAFDTKTNADDIIVTMKDGARIRKDDIVALSFEASTNYVSDTESVNFGFLYQKGILTKEQLIETGTKKEATLEDNIMKLCLFIDVNNIDKPYSAIAFVEVDGNRYYGDKVVTRSVTEVASKLGASEESYTKKIEALANTYYETTVLLNANGGKFEDDSSTKTLTLKEPCEFPVPTKQGYRIANWKEEYPLSSIKYEVNYVNSYPGMRKQAVMVNYTAIWEEIPTAKKLISQLVPQDLVEGDELPLEYDGKELEWSVESNDYITINSGKVAYKKAPDHKSHIVNVTLKYNGEQETKEFNVAPVQLKDLTGKSPFAIYFAIGSLSNFTSYPGHSVDNLFSKEVKEELDIVYYAFAYPNADGTLSLSKSGQYNTVYNQLMDLRKNGTRIVLSISGTSSATCGYFNDICGSDTKRKIFVNNLCDLMEQEIFDGIDIDWESASSDNCVVATKLTKLMKDLRTEMNKRSGEGPKYTLTCATPATSWGAAKERFDFSKINQYLDYVNMMSYDLNHETNASHVSALYNSSNDHGYGFSADYGAKQFKKLGLSPEKIIIGTAGYGKTYKNVEKGTNETYPGIGNAGTLGSISGVSGSFNSGTIYYSGVLQLLKNSNYKQYTEYNKAGQYVGNYLYSETDKIFVAYEGEEMIKEKVKYAKENGYGIMIWSYCEDGSGNLCQAIAENIHK